METFSILFGCSDRRINNHVEIALREVCYEQALVQCSFTHRLDAWSDQAASQSHHLLVLAPDHLVRGIGGTHEKVGAQSAAQAVRAALKSRTCPILGFTSNARLEEAMLQAGVERVFPPIFNEAVLRDELRRVLNLGMVARPSPAPPQESFSLAGFFARRFQRPRHA